MLYILAQWYIKVKHNPNEFENWYIKHLTYIYKYAMIVGKENKIMTEKKIHEYSLPELSTDYIRSLQRWQECTCRPQDALLCPVCREYNRQKYGQNIPIIVDGKEVIP